MMYYIWGLNDGDFEYLEASGKSGGLLSIWNKNSFLMQIRSQGGKFYSGNRIMGEKGGVDRMCLYLCAK